MLTAPVKLGPMPASRRMRTVDEQVVRASLDRAFAIAADVERWPAHLAHYRFVRYDERDGADGGIVQMSANRPFGPLDWPTWWRSLMEVRPPGASDAPVIRFRHIGGITTDMDVEWSFAPVADGVRVRIVHLWDGPRWPLVSTVAAVGVIGPVFVHGIASRTLAGLARAMERAGQAS
jgi:hypothetical protein